MQLRRVVLEQCRSLCAATWAHQLEDRTIVIRLSALGYRRSRNLGVFGGVKGQTSHWHVTAGLFCLAKLLQQVRHGQTEQKREEAGSDWLGSGREKGRLCRIRQRGRREHASRGSTFTRFSGTPATLRWDPAAMDLGCVGQWTHARAGAVRVPRWSWVHCSQCTVVGRSDHVRCIYSRASGWWQTGRLKTRRGMGEARG